MVPHWHIVVDLNSRFSRKGRTERVISCLQLGSARLDGLTTFLRLCSEWVMPWLNDTRPSRRQICLMKSEAINARETNAQREPNIEAESSKRRQFSDADCVYANAELNHQFHSIHLLVNAIISLLPCLRRISHFTNGDGLKAKRNYHPFLCWFSVKKIRRRQWGGEQVAGAQNELLGAVHGVKRNTKEQSTNIWFDFCLHIV